MLDLLWHLRGSVPLDGVGSNEAALDRVARLLEKQRKDVSKRGANYLAFDDPLWSDPFALNWLAMVIYDRGRFWIEQDLGGRTLRYDLRSLHILVFCLFGALSFFLFGFASGGLGSAVKWGAAMFLWLYGMNVLLAFARVPNAIRRTVRPS